MKILFICGCIEPGKDGVGDYVQILANELRLMGVEPAILALNDHFLRENKADNSLFPTLRLCSGNNWVEKTLVAQDWISEFKPDYIVWQFVIYAFDPRGITFLPLYHIANLLKKYPNVSFMFHEIWVGTAKEDKFSDKCSGRIQKVVIKWLTRRINPIISFTSNRTYRNLLIDHGIKSNLLPPFSNIPYVSGADILFKEYLDKHHIVVPEEAIKIGLFGRIPWSWQLQAFTSHINKTLSEQPVFIFVAGRSDQMSARELEKIFGSRAPGVKFIVLGEQAVNMISGFLQFMDFGIAINATQTLGKSGVFAAYREHGLPTILAGTNKQYNIVTNQYEPIEHLTIELDEHFSENLKKVKRLGYKNTRAEIACKFLEQIRTTETELNLIDS